MTAPRHLSPLKAITLVQMEFGLWFTCCLPALTMLLISRSYSDAFPIVPIQSSTHPLHKLHHFPANHPCNSPAPDSFYGSLTGIRRLWVVFFFLIQPCSALLMPSELPSLWPKKIPLNQVLTSKNAKNILQIGQSQQAQSTRKKNEKGASTDRGENERMKRPSQEGKQNCPFRWNVPNISLKGKAEGLIY